MKNTLAVLILACFGFSAIAQDVQITPFAGYQLGGKLKLETREVRFDNGPAFGLRVSRGFQGKSVEISYAHFLTEAALVESNEVETEREKASMGYIEAAMVLDLGSGDNGLYPFFLISAGSAYLKVNTLSGSAWAFNLGVGGGLKYFFTEKIGIRAEARFLVPMYFRGYCGWNYCYSEYRAVPQGAFTGGLVFRVGG
jgi:opacity protein-like surface antigen